MTSLPGLTVVALAAACGASTPPLEPPASAERQEQLRASEHLAIAEQHAKRAATLALWLDAQAGPDVPFDAGAGLWYETWATVRADEEETQRHLAAAADLRAEFERACRGRRPVEIRTNAIERHGRLAIPMHDGVLVVLAPGAGPADHLVGDLRCHRAWMMLGETAHDARGQLGHAASMRKCALDVPGLDVVAYGDHTGISVELTVSDRSLVPELQKRVTRELRAAERWRASDYGPY